MEPNKIELTALERNAARASVLCEKASADSDNARDAYLKSTNDYAAAVKRRDEAFAALRDANRPDKVEAV